MKESQLYKLIEQYPEIFIPLSTIISILTIIKLFQSLSSTSFNMKKDKFQALCSFLTEPKNIHNKLLTEQCFKTFFSQSIDYDIIKHIIDSNNPTTLIRRFKDARSVVDFNGSFIKKHSQINYKKRSDIYQFLYYTITVPYSILTIVAISGHLGPFIITALLITILPLIIVFAILTIHKYSAYYSGDLLTSPTQSSTKHS